MKKILFLHRKALRSQINSNFTLLQPDGGGLLVLQFLEEPEASFHLRSLEEELLFPLERPIILHGPNVAEPRDVIYQGNLGVGDLHYGPIKRKACPWTQTVRNLRDKLCSLLWNNMEIQRRADSKHLKMHQLLSAVLINKYNNGNDSMGYHSDDEEVLDDLCLIASLSLGSRRTMLFLNKISGEELQVSLPSGALVLMFGRDFQKAWKHAVPKDGSCSCIRLNLSFRFHK